MFVMEVSYLEAAGSRECLARYLQRQNVRYGGDAVLSMWRTSAYYCERCHATMLGGQFFLEYSETLFALCIGMILCCCKEQEL